MLSGTPAPIVVDPPKTKMSRAVSSAGARRCQSSCHSATARPRPEHGVGLERLRPVARLGEEDAQIVVVPPWVTAFEDVETVAVEQPCVGVVDRPGLPLPVRHEERRNDVGDDEQQQRIHGDDGGD
jgi:hypothetical protein